MPTARNRIFIIYIKLLGGCDRRHAGTTMVTAAARDEWRPGRGGAREQGARGLSTTRPGADPSAAGPRRIIRSCCAIGTIQRRDYRRTADSDDPCATTMGCALGWVARQSLLRATFASMLRRGLSIRRTVLRSCYSARSAHRIGPSCAPTCSYRLPFRGAPVVLNDATAPFRPVTVVAWLVICRAAILA